jgi:hypothetical protein
MPIAFRLFLINIAFSDLEAYDRNDNFGGCERVEREYEMKVPNYDQFKDINKDM